MLAVFQFLWLEASHSTSRKKARKIREEGVNGSADVLSGISTLVSLRLISKVGGAGAGNDVLDGGSRYRVNVGWDLVRGLGRGVGIEIEEFVAE